MRKIFLIFSVFLALSCKDVANDNVKIDYKPSTKKDQIKEISVKKIESIEIGLINYEKLPLGCGAFFTFDKSLNENNISFFYNEEGLFIIINKEFINLKSTKNKEIGELYQEFENKSYKISIKMNKIENFDEGNNVNCKINIFDKNNNFNTSLNNIYGEIGC